MILDELVLHDFGVYRGRQTFSLTPDGPERPIILIGAQNGAGKTTFLEGLQLALYGRVAQTGWRGAGGYDAYLQSSIHRLASPKDGAQVELKFRRTVAGNEQQYALRRSWSVQKSGVRELFEVVVDGRLDRVLTEHWAEVVEEMLPPRIAPLFFFDGEKLEQFADPKRSAEIISTAVKALLGLDIVERLELDLDVLERRKLAEQAKSDVRAELAAAEAAVALVERSQASRFEALASIRTRRDRSDAAALKARANLKRHGGELFASRDTLLDTRTRMDAAVEAARRDLRAWAGEAAPLLMVRALMEEVREQSKREADTESTGIILKHLVKRDRDLLAMLTRVSPDNTLVRDAEAFLADDRAALESRATGEAWIALTGSARLGLEALFETGLAEATLDRDELLARLEGQEARRDDLDRQIAAMPASETIEPFVRELTACEGDLLENEAELIVAARDFEAAERDVANAKLRYQSVLDHQVRTSLAHEDANRIVRHSEKARATLQTFKHEVINHHIHRLERFMLEALRELLRKSDLVTDVRIDPISFTIELRDAGWGVLAVDQLSAGERQLVAVALLWALAKASGQAAPTVIDTPLGRLDSQHRSRLIERYFPFAGDQVILLSTDKEVDGDLYARLEPSISRSFTVRYDSATGGSVVEAGYAFEAGAMEAA